MNENSLADISSFLDSYKDFSKRLERQKIIHFKTKFDGLLSGYGSLKNMIKVLERKEAGNYNIFDILNIKASEVKTHTPFLKNLLDPNGTHGQGDLFLRSFIAEFIPDGKKEHFELSVSNDYNVIEEKFTASGRIDIYIHSLNPQKKFGIVIENKIYGPDQENQLKRYYDFLDEIKGFTNDQLMMFYLTIYGGDPSPNSIELDLREKLKANNVFRNISYKEDITRWLTESSKEIQANRVKDLVAQYLSILKII